MRYQLAKVSTTNPVRGELAAVGCTGEFQISFTLFSMSNQQMWKNY